MNPISSSFTFTFTNVFVHRIQKSNLFFYKFELVFDPFRRRNNTTIKTVTNMENFPGIKEIGLASYVH